MSTIRAFIAIDLTPAIHSSLRAISQQLSRETHAVRWVAPESIHLTLKFLGEIDCAGLPALQEALVKEAAKYAPFELHVGGLGAFPSLRRPRAIWVGVQAPPDLAAVQAGIETATRTLGYSTEGRPFSPHLTLGRVSQHATPGELTRLSDLLAITKVGEPGAARVEAITLFKSDLRPSGAVYTVLVQANLGI
jgi:RNA 2',3'-cyclic 3'-phosphodiesterase